MKKRLLTLALLSSFTALASEKPTNFLEIGVTEWNYKKPAVKSNGVAGKLNFTEVRMSRSDMTFNLENKDNIFNAAMTYKNNVIGFKANYMKFDFDMGKDTGFNDIHEMNTTKSLAVINPGFFSFGGKSFDIKMDDVGMKFNNFYMFCSANDPDLDMASAEGIEQGCMTEFFVSPERTESPMTMNIQLDYEDGDKMDFNAELGEINLTGGSVFQINAMKSNMTMAQYFMETSNISASCLKDEDQITFESEIIKKQCENSLTLEVPKIILRNKKDETKFYIETKNLSVANEHLYFVAPVIQFVDKESSVTTKDLVVKCAKSEDSILYDLHSIISECIKFGRINIKDLISRDEYDLWFKYEDIMSKGFDPLAHIKDKEKTARNIEFQLDNGRALVKASAYKKILGKYARFDVYIKGTVDHYPAKDQIVLNVDEIKVPIGWFKIKWKKFLLKIMKKALVGENIQFNGDKITIQL
jgi:hypothetical protein